MQQRPTPNVGTRTARQRSGKGGRIATTIISVALLAAAIAYLAPYVGSQPVRVEAEAPKPVISKEEKHSTHIDEYFSYAGPIPELAFELKQAEWDNLGKDARRYVECKMYELGGKAYKGVGVKLKGSAGSFRGPEDKPGLTVSFEKFKGAERFHGMEKFHLNNGAQDNTFLMELMSGEVGRAAGVPASRCTHAFTVFHHKDFGLYIIKEAFTRDFLAKFFKETDGDLYDGGFVHEIDINMVKDKGDESDRTKLRELIDACNEANAKKTWDRLERILDVDKFISFIAMEAILAHWDGYNFNHNNYRLYFDSETGKAYFFLHGMDQTWGDANFAITREPGSLVGQAVMANPAWKPKYRERVQEIYEKVLKPIDWGARVSAEGEKVALAWEKKNPDRAKEYRQLIPSARDRIVQRIAAIGRQLGDMPKPPQFDKDNALKVADNWRAENAGGNLALDEAANDGKKCLHFHANADGAASWRRAVTLTPGKYRFEAQIKTAGVVGIEDARGRGAYLRISGTNSQQHIEGDSPWKLLAFDFESSGSEVTLVAEVRARKGDAWIDRDSLRLIWIK